MGSNADDRRSVNKTAKEKLTTEFHAAFKVIFEALKEHVSSLINDPDSYDRILIKQNLATADLLLQDDNGHCVEGTTYYISLTTKMRGFVPVLSDDKDVNVNPKMHPFQLVLDKVFLDKTNLEYLSTTTSSSYLSDYFKFNNEGICSAKVSVKESVKSNDAQTHLGVDINNEEERPFTEFRKLLEKGDCLIGFKKKGLYEYYFYGLKKKDADSLKDSIKEKFYFNGNYTTTRVSSSILSECEENESANDYKGFVTNSKQIIYYGVPGSGKSNAIEELTSEPKIASAQKVRVVFHPDYSNADFVGQIMPKKVGDSISYDFKAGPFADILKRAYDEPNKPFYLIVEEINRGNAAAIFGDVFQLLDRDDEGWSKYGITNEEVSKIIHGDELAKKMGFMVKLPPNLSILATMNTSDQNVFTLDNAFQRRWNMVHVKNAFPEDLDESKAKDKAIINQRDASIEGTSLAWGKFLFGDGDRPGINSIISSLSYNSGMSSLEDKRLGCWFVINKDGEIAKGDFSNKVLKYLWDDAFHFDKSVFADGIESFDDLIDAFENGEQLFKELHIDYESENDNEPTQSGE